MKKITYICDLCNEEESIDKVLAYKLVGMCDNHPDTSKKKIELTRVKNRIENSSKHICFTCADLIAEWREKIKTTKEV
jgi:hypothetical protein